MSGRNGAMPRPAATPPAAWSQAMAAVHRHEDRGAGHRWLDLALEAPFTAPQPGQFVQFLFAPPSPVTLPRPMSVAAARRVRGRLVVGFLYAPVGAGTLALSRLREGDPIEVLGPLGRGYPLERPGTPVLVAGGRGVAPLLFAAEALGRSRRRVEFLFGARDRAHLVAAAEARERIAALGGRLHLATDDGSRGFRGTVLARLDRLAPALPPPLVIHACGPHPMLAAVARWALRHGASAHLAMESIMACGTGVCRGCPLPRSAAGRAGFDPARVPSLYGNREYAMCCTEGPVFGAGDLDWDLVH